MRKSSYESGVANPKSVCVNLKSTNIAKRRRTLQIGTNLPAKLGMSSTWMKQMKINWFNETALSAGQDLTKAHCLYTQMLSFGLGSVTIYGRNMTK